jgi:hypothetical protein
MKTLEKALFVEKKINTNFRLPPIQTYKIKH